MASQIPYNQAVATTFQTATAIPTNRFNAQRFNQIVRAGFQLSGTPFANQAALMLKANWDTLIAATNATRMIISPPFSNSKITQSKPIMINPDSNQTYRGEPVYFGEGTSEFSAEFLDTDAAVIDTFFTTISPFSMFNNGVSANSLTWYPCNNDGMLFSSPTWSGLPAIACAPRSRGGDGLNSSDKIGFTLYLPPNWDGGTTLPTPTVPVGAGAVNLNNYAW